MRKVSKSAAEALLNYSQFNSSNTVVTVEDECGGKVAKMYLHGNMIAKLGQGVRADWLDLDCCGWDSVTTKERLNTLLSVAGHGRPYYHCKGQFKFNDLEIEDDDRRCLALPPTLVGFYGGEA